MSQASWNPHSEQKHRNGCHGRMLSSRHDTDVALLNSEPASVLWGGKRTYTAISLSEYIWVVSNQRLLEEGRREFFRRVALRTRVCDCPLSQTHSHSV